MQYDKRFSTIIVTYIEKMHCSCKSKKKPNNIAFLTT